jgi:hypothetical protein
VGADPHAEQLVAAQAERVEHLRLDLGSGRSMQAARIAS